MREPVRELRRELNKLGGSVIVYLDNILFLLPTYDVAIQARAIIEQVVTRYGITRHPKKGFGFSDEPRHEFVHLGSGVSLSRGVFFVPPNGQAGASPPAGDFAATVAGQVPAPRGRLPAHPVRGICHLKPPIAAPSAVPDPGALRRPGPLRRAPPQVPMYGSPLPPKPAGSQMVDPALYSLRCGPSSLALAVGHLHDSGRQHRNRLGGQSRCLSADGRPNSGPRPAGLRYMDRYMDDRGEGAAHHPPRAEGCQGNDLGLQISFAGQSVAPVGRQPKGCRHSKKVLYQIAGYDGRPTRHHGAAGGARPDLASPLRRLARQPRRLL
jgi:hypothetical protein